MEIDLNEYKLRCQLRGHEDYVRGISVCNENVATSSEDGTIRIWSPDPSDKRKYTLSKILSGHTSSVGPLAWIPPTVGYPEGRLVSGSMDTFVFVWNLTNGKIIHKLDGHKMQVTGVTLDNGDIVSSSDDQTLIRWKNGELVESWKAHNSPIQSVIRLPSGELVSGSSDPSLNLKLWNGNTRLRTFKGHTDTVRGLAVMPHLGFVSASLDGSIRLWDPQNGEVRFEMVGDEMVGDEMVGDILASIIHSVDAHSSGLIVSGSEDGYVTIWKDGVYRQSLEHPGCVCDVKFLESGDIVTACSDGVVRVWTVRHDLIAYQQEIDAYDSQLSQFKSYMGDQRDVYVLWDIENVHIPSAFNPALIRKRIRRALIELGFVGDYFKIDCVVGIRERVSQRVADGLLQAKIPIRVAGDRQSQAADKHLRKLLWQWLHEAPDSGVVVIISSDDDLAKCVRIARNHGSSSVVFANEQRKGPKLVRWAEVAVTWQSVLHGEFLKHMK